MVCWLIVLKLIMLAFVAMTVEIWFSCHTVAPSVFDFHS